MHVNACPVDQLQDGGVYVPNLVGFDRTNSDLGFGRIDTISGPLPTLSLNDSKPACLRCKDFAKLATESNQRTGRQMAKSFVLDHVAHSGDFGTGKLAWMALWAGG